MRFTTKRFYSLSNEDVYRVIANITSLETCSVNATFLKTLRLFSTFVSSPLTCLSVWDQVKLNFTFCMWRSEKATPFNVALVAFFDTNCWCFALIEMRWKLRPGDKPTWRPTLKGSFAKKCNSAFLAGRFRNNRISFNRIFVSSIADPSCLKNLYLRWFEITWKRFLPK